MNNVDKFEITNVSKIKVGGIADISRITGILPPNVVKLAKRKEFPVPVFELPHKRLWNLEEVIKWIDKNRRERPLKKIKKIDAEYDKYIKDTKKNIAIGDIAIPEDMVVARGKDQSVIANLETGDVNLVTPQTEFEILREAHADAYKRAGLISVAADILKTENILELRMILLKFRNA